MLSILREESGLPFFEVILNTNLPKGASNPVSTVQAVKRRFLQEGGEYSQRFDYMFFTESDQVGWELSYACPVLVL